MSTATDTRKCPQGRQGLHLYEPITHEGQTHCLDCGHTAEPVEILADLVHNEPPQSSVVVEKGPSGTAWQLHTGGQWRSTTGRTARWSALVGRSSPGSRLWLVYVPPIR